ncbi:MAG: hypothetical protein ABFR65_10095, partial [Pseudomonadota bacterium]
EGFGVVTDRILPMAAENIRFLIGSFDHSTVNYLPTESTFRVSQSFAPYKSEGQGSHLGCLN